MHLYARMMTSSNINIFRVTGPFCREFTGLRWIPRKKASNAELWYFIWSASESTIEETIVRLVILDAIVVIIRNCNESEWVHGFAQFMITFSSIIFDCISATMLWDCTSHIFFYMHMIINIYCSPEIHNDRADLILRNMKFFLLNLDTEMAQAF